jgi:uncharacterized RDD family membrane protein YckC
MDTPQNHSLEIAGIGARSWAFVIDWHIRFFGAFLVFMIAYISQLVSSGLYTNIGPSTIFLPFLIYFLYHPVLEVLFHGQSPGKRIVGIRVVRANGDAANAWQILVRNIFRIIDCLPFCYSVGLLTGLCSKNQTRVGDQVAGTVLVYLI